MIESTLYEIRLNGTIIRSYKEYDTQEGAEREAAIIRRGVPKRDNVQVFKVHTVLCDGDWEL